MSLKESMLTLLEYNEAITRRVWDGIRTLRETQFTGHFDYSHGSIRDLMVHMTVVNERWLRGLKGEPDARTYTVNPLDFPTAAIAFEYWESISIQLMDYARSLDEGALEETPMGMSGPVWQVLFHLVNHATDHRAQILWALHGFGAPTFDQDFILYKWFRQ